MTEYTTLDTMDTLIWLINKKNKELNDLVISYKNSSKKLYDILQTIKKTRKYKLYSDTKLNTICNILEDEKQPIKTLCHIIVNTLDIVETLYKNNISKTCYI